MYRYDKVAKLGNNADSGEMSNNLNSAIDSIP